jgi:predicted RNase H-like HicB family nuclease
MNSKVSIQIEKAASGYLAHSPEIEDSQIQGDTFDQVVSGIKETIRVYLDRPSPPSVGTTGQALLDLFDDTMTDMTPGEIAQLPSDGAEQHDHYIYGTPKRLG